MAVPHRHAHRLIGDHGALLDDRRLGDGGLGDQHRPGAIGAVGIAAAAHVGAGRRAHRHRRVLDVDALAHLRAGAHVAMIVALDIFAALGAVVVAVLVAIEGHAVVAVAPAVPVAVPVPAGPAVIDAAGAVDQQRIVIVTDPAAASERLREAVHAPVAH